MEQNTAKYSYADILNLTDGFIKEGLQDVFKKAIEDVDKLPQHTEVGRYEWQKSFYETMEANGYKRAEHIPEIADSVDEFQNILDKLFQAPPQSIT